MRKEIASATLIIRRRPKKHYIIDLSWTGCMVDGSKGPIESYNVPGIHVFFSLTPKQAKELGKRLLTAKP